MKYGTFFNNSQLETSDKNEDSHDFKINEDLIRKSFNKEKQKGIQYQLHKEISQKLSPNNMFKFKKN